MAELFHTATEYVANQLTISRGSVEDIVTVGVYHDEDPGNIPEVGDFTAVTLVDGTGPLAEGGRIDVLSLIGPGGDEELVPGDYQRWVLVQTATENIIRRVDVLEIK